MGETGFYYKTNDLKENLRPAATAAPARPCRPSALLFVTGIHSILYKYFVFNILREPVYFSKIKSVVVAGITKIQYAKSSSESKK